MPLLDYKSDEKGKADDRLNPSEDARDLYKQENDATPEYGDLDNSPTTDSTVSSGTGGGSSKNIDAASKKERDAGGSSMNYTGGGKDGGPKPPITAKDWSSKKKPLAVILILLFGSGGLLMVLFSPGALIVNFKERVNAKFNDQLAAMDVRTTALIKKKFKGTTSGICTTKLTIRCRYETIPERHLKKLEKAFIEEGGKVNSEKTAILKRHKLVSIIKPDGTVVTAENFNQELKDPLFKKTMLKGYNPKLAGFADATFQKLSRKVGIDKQQNVKGGTEAERKKSIINAANGTAIAEADARVTTSEEDCSDGDGCEDGKRTVYKDEATGKTISKEEYNRRIEASSSLGGEFEARRALAETGGSVAKGTLKGALTSTAFGLGAVDSACTGYTLIRAVGFAAKYLGALQLLRFAQVIMNTGDLIKAGDAKPEPVETVGKILTTPNSQGDAATDSYGYRYADYGDVNPMPRSENVSVESAGADGNNIKLSANEQERIEINDETTKYINGQLVSDNLLTNIIGLVGEVGSVQEIDDFCGFVKSGWGQTIIIGAALVGVVAAFFSGGLSLGWGAAAQVSVSVAISVAIAMLTPKLADMASGTLIGTPELTNGNRAGNAAISGAGAYNDQTSQARAIPALQKEDAPAYQTLTLETQAQYAAIDRADHSPFDPSNPNTFMGSLVSKLIPYTSKVSNVGSGISALTQFTTTTFAGIIPKASAQDASAQFEICEDADYKQLNLAVDPFCNIRHGLSGQTLATDPDNVAAYMEKNYVDEETGQPKEADNDYAKYIENCIDRSVSLGGYTESNDNKGEECIQGTASKTPSTDPDCSNGSDADNEECKRNMFRLFYVDFSIEDGMEKGFAPAALAAQTSSAAPAECQTMAPEDLGQIACHAYQFDNYGYLWGGGHGSTAEGFMSKFKSGGFVAGKDSILDCSGLIRMAIYDAFQIDIGGMATGSYPTFSKFQEVSKEESKAGDILWKDGHTELVVSNDTTAKKWQTVGAHTADTAFDKQIGATTYSYSGFTKVFRFQK